MKHLATYRALAAITGCCALIVLAGCNGNTGNQITFLDIVQTVLLGITAAGGIAIIQNV